MKTVLPYLFATCLLFPWCDAQLFAQQNAHEKKITITKRTTEADGTEITETIIKKGRAAENFDVDQYVRENRSDRVQVEVNVEEGGGSRSVSRGFGRSFNFNWSGCQDDGAFLGIETDADEDASQPGIVVQVVPHSAAAQAGLKTNDVLLRIGDQAMNRWSDVTAFMAKAKPGDKVRLTYLRNGREATAEATLTKHSAVPCTTDERHGFLGVSDQNDDDDDNGVEVRITANSAAAKAGLQTGDRILQLNTTTIADFEDISDFMEDTQPGEEITVTYERDGQRGSAKATLGEEQGWDWEQWSSGNWDWENTDIDVQQKEACLGVYTEASGAEDDSQGARIISFTNESAAKDAQLLQNDVITAVNGQRVQDHSDLWTEIAKYKAGDRIKVDYRRGNETRSLEVALKPCADNASQVTIGGWNGDGGQQSRRFNTWNWSTDDQQQMREHRLITIHKGGEGDAAKVEVPANPPTERKLQLESFRAFPNPAQGQVSVEFRAAPVATVVSLLDLNGRQLFREELNMFGGEYSQQFDLSEYAKGTLIILVQQGEKLFTDQIIIN